MRDFDNTIQAVIDNLRRFPQGAYLDLCGDRGLEDLRVFAPVSGNTTANDCDWKYYRLSATDDELPWLHKENA